VHTNRSAPNFQQWVRAKDAERRLKKKLIAESKREIRQELIEYAKTEKLLHDSRIQQMESWLIKKKLNEAYNIT
jgi:predicted transposase YdaD